ncbi:MAG: mechanosensitive ion channel [Candidatus Eisenbacteria bacterium]|nr:mechanosensitive ion channel [Candidatus Eisenbacteria bacterium]
MEALVGWFADVTGMTPENSEKVLWTIAVIVLMWALRSLTLRIVWRRTDDARTRYGWGKVTGYVSALIAVIVIVRLWFAGFGQFATFAGLVSAGVAIALRDVIADFAAWIFIVTRRPFQVGDRIQIADHRGDVIDIRVFQFTLMEVGNWVHADQSTGRVLHIPNGLVMTTPLANYSRGFRYIWNEIPVLITFESDWKKAKAILEEVIKDRAENLSDRAQRMVREASKKFMIFYQTLTPTVYTSVEASGVLLTMRYLCRPRRRRGTEQFIWEDVLEAFAREPDIDFAYPTQRFYSTRDARPSQDDGEDTPAP